MFLISVLDNSLDTPNVFIPGAVASFVFFYYTKGRPTTLQGTGKSRTLRMSDGTGKTTAAILMSGIQSKKIKTVNIVGGDNIFQSV